MRQGGCPLLTRCVTKWAECAPGSAPQRALGEKNVHTDTNRGECDLLGAHSSRLLFYAG